MANTTFIKHRPIRALCGTKVRSQGYYIDPIAFFYKGSSYEEECKDVVQSCGNIK